jgi:hypothetical protein
LAKKRKKQREGFFDDYDPDPTPTSRRKTRLTLLLDPHKVAQLMRDSMLPVKEPPKLQTNLDYHTYTMEEASAMVREYLDSKPKDVPSGS